VKKFINLKILSVAITACSFFISNDSFATPLASPEIEVLSASDRLDEIKTRAFSESNISESRGFGSAPISAHKSFNLGKNAFKNSEYLSALRNIDYYLKNTNVPNHKQFSEAHLISAKSAQRLGRYETAFDHYLEFLSFSTTPGTSSNIEIRNAISEVLTLTSVIKPKKKYQLSQILSSIISLDVDPNLKSEILFLAAKSATNFNMPELANKWIEEAKKSTKSNSLKLRGLYFQALLDVSSKNLEEAREKLLLALTHKGGSTSPEEYAIAQLALARIAYTIGDFDESISYYKQIEARTTSATDAEYELIYAYFKKGEFKNAHAQAKKFASNNPSHQNAKFSNTLIAYLGLKSGTLTETEENIGSDIKFLTTFTKELQGKLGGGNAIGQEDLSEIKTNSFSFASQSPYLERSIRLFDKIEGLETLSAKVQGKISGLLTDLWNARLHDINPHHIERSKQLKDIVYELLDIGHRLSTSEFELAKGKISNDNLISYQRSVKRRLALLNNSNDFSRYKENIKETVKSISLNMRLQSIQEKLVNSNERLASAEYIAKADKNNDAKFDLNTQRTRLSRARIKFSSLLSKHRSMYLENIYKQTPLTSTKELMTIYSLDLLTESRIFAEWRDKNLSPVTKKLSWQFHDAWMKWFNTADFVFHELEKERSSMQIEIESLVKNITEIQTKKQEILMKIFKVRDGLASQIGEDSPLLLSHYSNAAGDRISEKQKWLADIEWLKFKNIENDAKKIDDEYKQEKRILDENLTDQLRGINN
jgi:outer membrane protein assembly factor BamD (BamD/ComL family)